MDTENSAASISTMRLYGSLIALVSGGYSSFQSITGPAMTGSSWVMLVVGVIALVHGIVLLTPAVDRLGTASGPLMIGYAVVMLLNQGLMTTDTMSSGMDSGMGSSMDGGIAAGGMGVDVGMIAIAVLMLASGVIMTARGDVVHSGSSSSARDEVSN